MNQAEARELRQAHDSYVRALYREPKAGLAVQYRKELAARGRTVLLGGPDSKDELVRELAGLQFPLERMNESIHVLYHTAGVINSACPWCNPDPCPVCGAIATCTYKEGKGPVVNGRHVAA